MCHRSRLMRETGGCNADDRVDLEQRCPVCGGREVNLRSNILTKNLANRLCNSKSLRVSDESGERRLWPKPGKSVPARVSAWQGVGRHGTPNWLKRSCTCGGPERHVTFERNGVTRLGRPARTTGISYVRRTQPHVGSVTAMSVRTRRFLVCREKYTRSCSKLCRRSGIRGGARSLALGMKFSSSGSSAAGKLPWQSPEADPGRDT